MLNAGRNPSDASTNASLPALVGAILNAMEIPAGVIFSDPATPRPRGSILECSLLSTIWLASTSPNAPKSKRTGPADVLPTLPKGTTSPSIVRVTVSAAKIWPSKLICICFISSRRKIHFLTRFINAD